MTEAGPHKPNKSLFIEVPRSDVEALLEHGRFDGTSEEIDEGSERSAAYIAAAANLRVLLKK